VTDVENVKSSVVSTEAPAASNIPKNTSLLSNLPVNENNKATSSHSNILQKFISPVAYKQSSNSTTRAVTSARVLLASNV